MRRSSVLRPHGSTAPSLWSSATRCFPGPHKARIYMRVIGCCTSLDLFRSCARKNNFLPLNCTSTPFFSFVFCSLPCLCRATRFLFTWRRGRRDQPGVYSPFCSAGSNPNAMFREALALFVAMALSPGCEGREATSFEWSTVGLFVRDCRAGGREGATLQGADSGLT